METSVPATLVEQLPVAALMVVAIFILLKQFQNFIEKRDKNWQDFIREQRETDQRVIADVVSEIKNLAQEIKNLRGDFDRAVTKMDERTRQRRSKSQDED